MINIIIDIINICDILDIMPLQAGIATFAFSHNWKAPAVHGAQVNKKENHAQPKIWPPLISQLAFSPHAARAFRHVRTKVNAHRRALWPLPAPAIKRLSKS